MMSTITSSKRINNQRTSQTNGDQDIVLYDKRGYDYRTYWKNRRYEHKSEVLALSSLLAPLSGTWFLDIGGSFGRHMPLYAPMFKNCIIVDYSMSALQQAQINAHKNQYANVSFIAANIYHLPFKENAIDVAMMIRVIHHLENTDEACAKIAHIIKPSGTFILEYPNKKHLKARIRAIFKGETKQLNSLDPYSVPSQNPEGATSKDRAIMLNYNPQMIHDTLVSHGMLPYRQTSLSFFRIPVLKRFLPSWLMVAGESFLQRIAGRTTLTPSIMIASRKNGTPSQVSIPQSSNASSDLLSILACPACGDSLSEVNHLWTCAHCKQTFRESNGIYDFRYPTITE